MSKKNPKNQKKRKKQNNSNRREYYKAIVYGSVLIISLIIIVSKFRYSSEMNARDNVEKNLSVQTEVLANRMGKELMRIPGVGEGATTIVSNIEALSDSQRISFAHNLIRANSHIFKAAITDNEGRGFDSDGIAVDYSSADFYADSKSEEFTFTENDPIIGRSAYVCAVPCIYEEGVIGNIYLFIEQDIFDDYYDETIYNGDTAYAIIDSNGHMVSSSEGKSVYATGENRYSNLATGNLPALSLAQIKIRVVKGEKMAFKASNSEENREIAIAPFGIADWSLVTVINSDYVEKLVDDDTREARSLVNNIVILICIFVALLLVYVVINKIRFNEESADLADKADTDLLTGLNNKIATERKIQEYLDENPGVQCMMFLFDIDNFKKVNDTMGHAFGDELLKNLGHQLTNEFRVTDIIGRLGGDEFVVFLKNIKSDEQLSREGVRITTFFHHFKVGGYVQYSATASIGAVILPKDATTFEEAYKAADKALYEAKRRGKNQLVYYSREISDIESVRVTGDIESDKR